MKETRRKRLLVLVDGSEYEEFEYLKSVKGKLFDLFLMNQQFTQIFRRRKRGEAIAGFSTEVL